MDDFAAAAPAANNRLNGSAAQISAGAEASLPSLSAQARAEHATVYDLAERCAAGSGALAAVRTASLGVAACIAVAENWGAEHGVTITTALLDELGELFAAESRAVLRQREAAEPPDALRGAGIGIFAKSRPAAKPLHPQAKHRERYDHPRSEDAPPQEPPPGDAQDQPGAEPEQDTRRITIRLVAGELATSSTLAEDAIIAARRRVFQRGTHLVRPLVSPAKVFTSDGKTQRIYTPSILQLEQSAIIDECARSAHFMKYNGRAKDWVPTDPPANVAATILSRIGEWRFPILRGVLAAPSLRPDGSLLQTPGYDEATGLYLFPGIDIPTIPDRPTKDDAIAALAVLCELLSEFPFVDNTADSPAKSIDHAVALALLMTPTLRAAMDVAPLFVIDAPTPGTGKSCLLNTSAYIGTGAKCAVTSVGKDDAETEKRINGLMLEGRPFVGIDNVNGLLESVLLAQATSETRLSLRALGGSPMFDIDNTFTIVADGNNISVKGEQTRRTMRCRMDAGMERPETRTFRSNPLRMVGENRGRYVRAILVIARAFVSSGANADCRPLAGFESWTRFVRAPLTWLDCADPADCQNRIIEEDPETLMLRRVFGAIALATGGVLFTAAELEQLGHNDIAWPELHAVLVELFSDRKGEISTRRIGSWLGKYKDRVIGQWTLRRSLATAEDNLAQYIMLTKPTG